MFPESRYRFAQGMGLPMALFVIVVLSLVGLAVERSAETDASTHGHRIASVQAWYAANSGVQLWLPQVLASSPCSCPAGDTLVMTVAGLNGCSVVRQCQAMTVAGESYCTVSAVARCDGGNASRAVEVRVK
ncbi:pilus assembly PilX N-terminal domain-containing protein [Parathalassolituus penaei]|uniref:Pilus assembly PilX N-terminal domain-containing protein n=1 Tax=Parathalassolituus penaei TaxID=2997323 RepID=A0A9X3ISJ0_9GAMM|nr:pilus assembly PilX N-terminal domain-containing protein [Parathalassolituus penaei]MCY0964208.1 pilus assembly PilX N-terminal domain-containing protein [Parathalassolituus penaei]